MKQKNLEIKETGIVCDNPLCDWKDPSITYENYAEWVNRPCPKCGENVLTEEDFNNTEMLRIAADFINTLSEDELKELAGSMDEEQIKSLPMFSGTKGMENLKDGNVFTVTTHKEIKVVEIKGAE